MRASSSALRHRTRPKDAARSKAASSSTSVDAKAVAPTKRLLNSFLVVVYRHAVKVEHATPMPMSTLQEELELSEALAEKMADFLETEGLIDYDDQAVEITIPGMIRAEEILAPVFERRLPKQA